MLYLFHFLILRFRKFNKVQDCKKLVRKEGQQIGNEYFLIEMATDGWKKRNKSRSKCDFANIFSPFTVKIVQIVLKIDARSNSWDLCVRSVYRRNSHAHR